MFSCFVILISLVESMMSQKLNNAIMLPSVSCFAAFDMKKG